LTSFSEYRSTILEDNASRSQKRGSFDGHEAGSAKRQHTDSRRFLWTPEQKIAFKLHIKYYNEVVEYLQKTADGDENRPVPEKPTEKLPISLTESKGRRKMSPAEVHEWLQRNLLQG